MYTTEIIRTDKSQYVIIPGRVSLKMMDFLDMIGDKYEMKMRDDLPDGAPCFCTFKGKLMTENVIGFYTDIDPDCFMRIAEELDTLPVKEISPTGQWSKDNN